MTKGWLRAFTVKRVIRQLWTDTFVLQFGETGEGDEWGRPRNLRVVIPRPSFVTCSRHVSTAKRTAPGREVTM